MSWVGKNLAEQGVIRCIYDARDVGKVRSAIAVAYAAAVKAVVRCMAYRPNGQKC